MCVCAGVVIEAMMPVPVVGLGHAALIWHQAHQQAGCRGVVVSLGLGLGMGMRLSYNRPGGGGAADQGCDSGAGIGAGACSSGVVSLGSSARRV